MTAPTREPLKIFPSTPAYIFIIANKLISPYAVTLNYAETDS